jgi:hypothetical protein
MIEEFIKRQFKIRDAAHRTHWTTSSGYTHETLGGFYDGVVDQVDTLVEAYIAATREKPASPDDIITQIRAEMLWLAKHREELARGVPALENIVDTASQFYLYTLFKRENLK